MVAAFDGFCSPKTRVGKLMATDGAAVHRQLAMASSNSVVRDGDRRRNHYAARVLLFLRSAVGELQLFLMLGLRRRPMLDPWALWWQSRRLSFLTDVARTVPLSIQPINIRLALRVTIGAPEIVGTFWRNLSHPSLA